MSSVYNGKKFINVDSGFRLAGSSSEFRIELQNTIEDVRVLTLESCCVPFTWFDIRPTYHVPLQEDGQGITEVTVPSQHYSPTELASALAGALTTASLNGNTYTVSYNTQTGGYTITSDNSTFQLAWYTDFYTNQNFNNYMYYVLGFGALTQLRGPDPDTGYALSQTSSGVGMSSSPYLWLTVKPYGQNYTTVSNQTCFALIPVTGNFGDKVYYNAHSMYDQYAEFPFKGYNLRELLVTLRFADGTAVNLNGTDISLILGYTQFEDKVSPGLSW
jgi:hypothetical protein